MLDAPIPLWRRALVPPHVPLPLMSELLATLFDREDSIDQFRFVRGGVSWEIPRPFIETASLDAYRAVLADGLAEPGDVLPYEDDWGGLWRLDLRLERVRTIADLSPHRVVVLDGAGAPPPVYVGDMEEYGEWLAILADPLHPLHAEESDLVGPGFESDHFRRDLIQAEVNRMRFPACEPRFTTGDVTALSAWVEDHPKRVGTSLHDWAADFVYDFQRMLPTEFARTNRPHVLAAAALWLAGEEPPAPPSRLELIDVSELYGVPVPEIVRYAGLMREARRMEEEERKARWRGVFEDPPWPPPSA